MFLIAGLDLGPENSGRFRLMAALREPQLPLQGPNREMGRPRFRGTPRGRDRQRGSARPQRGDNKTKKAECAPFGLPRRFTAVIEPGGLLRRQPTADGDSLQHHDYGVLDTQIQRLQ